MKYFYPFITIFYLINKSRVCGEIAIECGGLDPVNFTSELRNRLHNNIFDTIAFVGTPKVYYPSPKKFAQSKFKFYVKKKKTGKYKLKTETYYNQVAFMMAKEPCIWGHDQKFEMVDENQAVFTMTNSDKVWKVCNRPGKNLTFNKYDELDTLPITFSLIYAPKENFQRENDIMMRGMYVYQTCDQSHAWLQVDHNEWKKYISKLGVLPDFVDGIIRTKIEQLLHTFLELEGDIFPVEDAPLLFAPEPEFG